MGGDAREAVIDLLGAINELIDWSKISKDVRKKWNTILAKRVAMLSRSVNSVEDFAERLLKELAGDAIFLSKEKANALRVSLDKARSMEKEVLDYVKRYPYLSVVFYAASKGIEVEGEG
ncbi:hypothetical protein [Candidatus Alkanophaga liquidiphilum]